MNHNSLNDISFTNAEGKNWVIPKRNTGTALEIYQPSGWRGKLIRRMLPATIPLGIVPIRHTETDLRGMIPDGVAEAIESCFGKNAELSYFGGTPGTHRKPTVQVFRGKEILGYVKYSKDPEIVQLFEHEQKVLAFLEEAGIRNVPECLTCREYKEGGMLFIQNTQKKRHAGTLHEFGKEHEDFLRELQEKTETETAFENTAFYRMLTELRRKTEALGTEDQRTVKQQIDKKLREYGRERKYYVCHRDFTPWNTCLVNRKLYVFDWEYARMTYPAGMDRARFMVETARRERHRTPGEIIREITAETRSLSDYLLDNLYLYLCRGRDSDRENITFTLAMIRERNKAFGTKE